MKPPNNEVQFFESMKMSEYSSRCSHKMNEEIFAEYNSNNDERLYTGSGHLNMPDYKLMVLIKSNDSPCKESLQYSLT